MILRKIGYSFLTIIVLLAIYFVFGIVSATIAEPIYNPQPNPESMPIPASMGINFNTTITAEVLPKDE